MRLLTKTTLYFLLAMVPLLFVAGFFLYQQFSREINHRMDEELITEEVQWIRYLRSQADNGSTFILKTPEILIYPVNAPINQYPTIQDSYGGSGGKNPYRQLSHVVSINGIPYQITIRRTQDQKAAMEVNITRLMLLVFIGLFVTTLLFNWLISERLWKPFRFSLRKIREAELQKMQAARFENTNIVEFNELNSSLNMMADKIYSDYLNMKEFTENAAHEMQTPLAIVQSKLELLLQDPNLSDSQVQAIVDSSDAISRLSRLNQSLLLLAKIENNQYEAGGSVNFADVTAKYLKLFDEMIKDKQLKVETEFKSEFIVNLHQVVADSLVSNLLGNAIKYNSNGGNVFIEVTSLKYVISNTSDLPPIDQKQVFRRFNKLKNSSESSNGLGLAIVKKICDTHNLSIQYQAENGYHRFVIEKKQPGNNR